MSSYSKIKLDHLDQKLQELSLQVGVNYTSEPTYHDYRPSDAEFAGVPYFMSFLDKFEVQNNPTKGYDIFPDDSKVAFRNTPLFRAVSLNFILEMAANWAFENWNGVELEPDDDEPEFAAWCERADNHRNE